ncbi:MAG: TlpA family protein disulfide reductase [Fibrobacterota bacterium]
MKKILWICTIVGTIFSTDLLPPGTDAPKFSLQKFGGRRESLSIWSGPKLSKPYINDTKHAVIISFWATYCLPCRKEIAQLHQFAEKYSDSTVKIFLISIDPEGADAVGPVVEEEKWSLPILLDKFGIAAKNYGVRSVPTMYVLDTNRTVIYAESGYNPDSLDLVPFLAEKLFGPSAKKTRPARRSDTGRTTPTQGDFQ